MHTQVLASIAGDFHATHWNGVANEDAYVQTATQSLLTYFRNFALLALTSIMKALNKGKQINGSVCGVESLQASSR